MAHAPKVLVSMLAVTLVAAGCGGKQVEETPRRPPRHPSSRHADTGRG